MNIIFPQQEIVKEKGPINPFLIWFAAFRRLCYPGQDSFLCRIRLITR